MGEGLSDIELLVTKISLEQKKRQLVKTAHAGPQRRVEHGLRVLELHKEKLRLERMRETLQQRRRFEQELRQGRTALLRTL